MYVCIYNLHFLITLSKLPSQGGPYQNVRCIFLAHLIPFLQKGLVEFYEDRAVAGTFKNQLPNQRVPTAHRGPEHPASLAHNANKLPIG